MRTPTEDAVSDIVKMRHRGFFEKYCVFYFHGIAYNGIFADKGRAADIRTMPYFRALLYYTWRADECCRCDRCRFVDPNTFVRIIILTFRQRAPRRQNILLDPAKCLPRELEFFEIFRCRGFRKVKKSLSELAGKEEHLTSILTDKEQELFTDYVATYIKFSSLCNADSFTVGFRLGARFAYDTFVEDKKG